MGHRHGRDHRETALLLQGYQLATAEILYHMPDRLELLQTFIWQEFDLAPRFPVLTDFLKFWEDNLDGPLHSVRVATSQLMAPAEFRAVDGVIRLH
ncbi:MAG: usg protein [Alphaproteobacteria bacterium]